MADRRTFVIVGGGLAGATAAATLREEGFEGEVLLLAAEPEAPYERPPLSKGYLSGASTLADALVHDASYYARHDIELVTGARADVLDAVERRVRLASGATLRYSRLLIATGAVPRLPPIDGADGEHVHVLRAVADADRLRSAIGAGRRLVIVGAGWIGCEVAAAARACGTDVTLIAAGATPLERPLGPQLGGFFAALHRARGVQLLTDAAVAAIDPGGRLVRLADGRTIEGDAVLLATGVRPAARLAEVARLAVGDGILANEHLRTSVPDVFVAGDVAAQLHPRYGRRVRVEHWETAKEQGAAAARSMLGARRPYAALPSFFSDQYDVGLEYVGLHGAGDALVIRGSVDDGPFQAFWIGRDGAVTAGMHVNDWDAIEPIRALVDHGTPMEAARLRDPDVPLAA